MENFRQWVISKRMKTNEVHICNLTKTSRGSSSFSKKGKNIPMIKQGQLVGHWWYIHNMRLCSLALFLSLSLNLIQCSERWLKRLLPLLLSLVLLQFSTVLTGQHYKVRICLIRQTDRQTDRVHGTAPTPDSARQSGWSRRSNLSHSLTHSHHFICSFVHLPLFIT